MPNIFNQTFTCDGNTYVTQPGDVVKCVIIIIIMILIIVGNTCSLVVFNSKQTRKLFMKRARYIMTSLCVTDLSIGLLMCPSTIYPALVHCWPSGEVMCKIEALLISALFHESTLNMVLVAIDRYCVIHHPGYNLKMTSRRFLFVILATWVVVFTTYAIVIFAGEQFYYDEIGINCEPIYTNPHVSISVISIFYFVPAAVFLFCYGAIYRKATMQKVLTISPDDKSNRLINANIRTSKYLAAITFGFFCAVSPWTICTLLIVAANISLHPTADYFVTWLALSNSFWNCLIYGVMNRKFRKAALRMICGKLATSLRDTITSRSMTDSRDYTEDTSLGKKRSRSNRQKSNRQNAVVNRVGLLGNNDQSRSVDSTSLHTPPASHMPRMLDSFHTVAPQENVVSEAITDEAI